MKKIFVIAGFWSTILHISDDKI